MREQNLLVYYSCFSVVMFLNLVVANLIVKERSLLNPNRRLRLVKWLGSFCTVSRDVCSYQPDYLVHWINLVRSMI
jgi:hypothetical protein